MRTNMELEKEKTNILLWCTIDETVITSFADVVVFIRNK